MTLAERAEKYKRRIKDFAADERPLMKSAFEDGYLAALDDAAKMAEDCIANGVVVLSAGEVASAIRRLAD